MADAVDPYGAAPYKLYRESTRLVDSHFVKDMSILNRDLGKVLCVDVDANAYKLQPENYIPLQRWKGEKGDGELIRLMTFLEGKRKGSLGLVWFGSVMI